MNLRDLSDESLLTNIMDLAGKEREITLKVLHHLREVERRSLYAVLSYSSLFEYAVGELKYSAGAAQRRISSMRLLKEIPELEEKIEKGTLNLSSLSQAQSFFRQEKTNVEEKRSLLISLENKSTREVEKVLISKSSQPENLVPEKLRPISETHTELKVLLEEKLLKEIDELRNLMSHSHPNASIKEVLTFAVTKTLERLRPKAPKEKLELKPQNKRVITSLPALEVKKDQTRKSPEVSRYIPRGVKRIVWQRDWAQCTYKDPVSGKKCTCKRALEFDHVIPFALGGETTVDNLRLRCRTHNQLAAVQCFGEKKIAQFVPRMR